MLVYRICTDLAWWMFLLLPWSIIFWEGYPCAWLTTRVWALTHFYSSTQYFLKDAMLVPLHTKLHGHWLNPRSHIITFTSKIQFFPQITVTTEDGKSFDSNEKLWLTKPDEYYDIPLTSGKNFLLISPLIINYIYNFSNAFGTHY